MFYYLLTGLILGCIATGYDWASSSSAMRKRALAELFIVSIAGTIFFSQLLPISLLSALAMATIFSVVNQLPKAYFRTDQGGEILDFIEEFPPFLLMVMMTTFAAWYLAVIAAIQWLLPLAVSDGMAVPAGQEEALFLLTVGYCIVTGVTTIISKRLGDIG
jgi:hypothetical protein